VNKGRPEPFAYLALDARLIRYSLFG
jgi:hypothetical protein